MNRTSSRVTLAIAAAAFLVPFATVHAQESHGPSAAVADTNPADAAPRYEAVPRSQRPSVMVQAFEFNATLSDEDKAALNTLGGVISALKGNDPQAAALQSYENIGRGISDLLVEQLLQSGNFRVVERKALDQIIKEQALVNSNAAQAGQDVAQKAKLLGAKYLITGSITKFGQEKKRMGGAFGKLSAIGGAGIESNTYTVAITARIADASTGEVVASITSDGEVKGGKKLALGGFGGGVGGAFAKGSSGDKEKKIGEAIALAVDNLVGKLVDARKRGDIEP